MKIVATICMSMRFLIANIKTLVKMCCQKERGGWKEGKADVGTNGERLEEKSGEWAERVAVNQKKRGAGMERRGEVSQMEEERERKSRAEPASSSRGEG